MARLQILELPEGTGDDRPPFALVIDQVQPQRWVQGEEPEPVVSPWEDMATRLGARTVLVFAETVEIPGNEIPIGPDGYPVRLAVEADLTRFNEQLASAQARARQGGM